MKKILSLIILMNVYVVHAQYGFNGSDQYFTKDSLDKIRLVQIVNFSYGSGFTCPPLSRFNQVIQNDSIILDLYYDTRGAWQSFFCVTQDTLYFNLPSGDYCFYVNTNLIDYHTSLNDSIIYLVEQDSTCNISVSINEQLNPTATELNLYPNPTNDYLFIEAGEGRNELAVQLFNLQGQLIKEVLLKKGERIDVSKLRPGLYYLKLTNPENQSQPKKFYIY